MVPVRCIMAKKIGINQHHDARKLNVDITAKDTTQAQVTLHDVGNVQELSLSNVASLLAQRFAHSSKDVSYHL